MKVTFINTSENNGGAAIACNRLQKAIQKVGIDAKLIVRDKIGNDPTVIPAGTSFFSRKLNFLRFCWERFVIFINNKFNRKDLFLVSIANTGSNISKLPDIKQADIINLHWVSQGFLSLKNIRQLIKTGKPIIWSMHDMWTYTGICHNSGNCTKYTEECKLCAFLKSTSARDLSTKTFRKKKKLFEKAPKLYFVGSSKWMADCARQSALNSKNINITSLPIPIDTDKYTVTDKAGARAKFNLPQDKKLLLFGAVKVTDERKGAQYFVEACKLLTQQYPLLQQEIAIIAFGKNTVSFSNLFPFQVHGTDFISKTEDIVALYNAADAFIIPSLEDNLPNTVIEALACGTPCVGFNAGGIPEMIDHKVNGFVAEYKSVEDLAKGIYWTLYEADYGKLTENACKKALDTYSEEAVAQQYLKFYSDILSENKS
ncbi:MAG: glycosyltransferase family 4 protein [Prevotellaceae bacterium]|jgi:glycosyltransferase involved in cell wall biosynthesis|nr:glycosyltransferase family 4 protein [Prevotellaceae bacterium]